MKCLNALGESWPIEKKNPQNGASCAWSWVTWLWKALDAKPLTPGQFQRLSFDTFSPSVHGIGEKNNLFDETLRTRKFSTGFFLGLVPTKFRGFRKSICFEFLSLRFEVIAAQSKTIETKWVVKQEISGVTKQRHSANLRPITCHSEIEWRLAQRSWANVDSISDLLVKNWWSVLALWHWTASAFRQHLNFNLKL